MREATEIGEVIELESTAKGRSITKPGSHKHQTETDQGDSIWFRPCVGHDVNMIMIPAAMAEPITPATFGPIACMSSIL